jgi:tetratricopeptide (TPR) repeat protein
MNKKDVMRICLMIIIFIWITIATMPYRLGIVQSKAGHFYDENMSSQEFLVLKQKEKLSKMKDVPLEAKWDCDEALGKIMWASFRPAVAADIFADTKRQREKAYKTYDKKLINTMVMLAAAYRDVNRMEESDALYEEVWKLDKENLLPGDSNLTRDQTNLAMINYLRGDSEEKLDLQKKYFKLCLEHIQRAQELWHQAKDPDIAKLVHLFFLKYLACRELGDEANSKQAYGEMKYLDKRVKHICYPPRT